MKTVRKALHIDQCRKHVPKMKADEPHLLEILCQAVTVPLPELLLPGKILHNLHCCRHSVHSGTGHRFLWKRQKVLVLWSYFYKTGCCQRENDRRPETSYGHIRMTISCCWRMVSPQWWCGCFHTVWWIRAEIPHNHWDIPVFQIKTGTTGQSGGRG